MGILRFLAYTNIWIALSAVSFLYLTAVEAGKDLNFPLLIFVGGGTFAAYFLMRIPAIKAQPAWNDAHIIIWQRALKNWLRWPALFLGLAAIISITTFPQPALIAAICAGILAISYSVGLPKISAEPRGLRNIPGLKLLVITTTWTVVTYVVPLLYWEQPLQVFGLMARIFMVAVLALLFDIRDAQKDEPTIKTLPQRWGLEKARLLAYALVALALGCFLMATWQQQIFTWPQFIMIWVILEINALMIYQSKYPQPDLFYAFGVEGLPIFMVVLVAFFN